MKSTIPPPISNAVYFVTDTQEIYKGDKRFTASGQGVHPADYKQFTSLPEEYVYHHTEDGKYYLLYSNLEFATRYVNTFDYPVTLIEYQAVSSCYTLEQIFKGEVPYQVKVQAQCEVLPGDMVFTTDVRGRTEKTIVDSPRTIIFNTAQSATQSGIVITIPYRNSNGSYSSQDLVNRFYRLERFLTVASDTNEDDVKAFQGNRVGNCLVPTKEYVDKKFSWGEL